MPTTGLDRLLRSEKLVHAYVLSGSHAPQCAQDFIQRLFCSSACGDCPQCIKLAHASHPDVLWLAPQGKNLKIEQVRDVQRNALYPPHQAPFKVYVIQQADALSREAANALLKILESPPSFAVFLLLTQHLGELLPTVVSRCRVLRVGATELGEDDFALCWGNPLWLELFEAVEECPPLEQHQQELVAALGTGQLKRMHAATLALFDMLRSCTVPEVLQASSALSRLERPNLEYMLQGFNYLLPQSSDRPHAQHTQAAMRLSLARSALKANANVQLLLESLLLTLWGLPRS